MSPYPVTHCAMVAYDLLSDWLSLPWMVIADLGEYHGQFSVMLGWKCCCGRECVKPKVDSIQADRSGPERERIAVVWRPLFA